ncbi:MAG: ribosomal protein S18-alanine N-acetyltransferase [Legionellales bacterium]|jgi:ribosomal-protein-alanine N-acetyltransferase
MATTQTSSDLAIRPMQAHDIETIAAIENSAYFAPWPKAAIQATLGVYPAFVLEKNSQIVGYSIFSHIKDEAHILNLVIKPEFQGQRFGRFLLQFILHILIENHVRQVSLEVALNNAAALRLYESFGFKRAGVRKEYYQTPEGRVDALILVYKPSYTGG